jgi:hypothetical protein
VLTDTILKGDHLRIISAKFGWDWLSSFRGEDFFYFIPLFSILHNRPKSENFNIYYGIFNELWTFADFDRLCKLEKRGMELKKILLWNYWANLNQTLLKWSLGGPLSKLCPSAPSCIQDGRHY